MVYIFFLGGEWFSPHWLEKIVSLWVCFNLWIIQMDERNFVVHFIRPPVDLFLDGVLKRRQS